jgi:4-hydroxybenzoate polyprenyltransferase
MSSKQGNNIERCIREIHVDLDGTLHAGDIVKESALFLLLRAPHRLVACLLRAVFTQVPLKQCISDALNRPVVNLSLNIALIDWLLALRRSRSDGVRIIINTGAPSPLIDRETLDCYLAPDGYLTATPEKRNVGEEKLHGCNPAELCYIGNSREDLPIFSKVRQIGVIGAAVALSKKFRLDSKTVYVCQQARVPLWKSVLSLIRAKHWLKNTLIFAAMLFAPGLDGETVRVSLGGFTVFCLLTSLVYVVNDLYDINADRLHDVKRWRPVASGAVNVFTAISLISLLAGTISLLVFLLNLPLAAVAVMAIYLAMNVVYSGFLKNVPFLNVLVMPVFYVLRVVFGLECLGIDASPTLLLFFFFGMTPLAVLKRVREIYLTDGRSSKVLVRGYSIADVPQLNQLATAGISVTTAITALFWLELYPSPTVLQAYLIVLSTILVFTGQFAVMRNPQLGDDDTFGMVAKNRVLWVCCLGFILVYFLLVKMSP